MSMDARLEKEGAYPAKVRTDNERSLGLNASKTGSCWPFFVVGASRSGTTLLRLFLTSHSMVHIPRETWFLIDLMQQLPDNRPLNRQEISTAKSLILNHVRWPDWEVTDEALHQAFDTQHAPFLHQLIRCLYEIEMRRTGKVVWGDKTPGYVLHIGDLSKLFPESRFIHLIRDARDVSRSLLSTKWHGRHLFRAASYWARSVGAGVAQGRELPPERYLEVFYEDLVLRSEETLRRISAFLHIPFEIGMSFRHQDGAQLVPAWARGHHQKLSRPPDPDDVGIWRRRMNRREVMVVEAIAGKIMDRVGQKRRNPRYLTTLGLGFQAADYCLRVTHRLRQRIRLTRDGSCGKPIRIARR